MDQIIFEESSSSSDSDQGGEVLTFKKNPRTKASSVK
jgi:hypothetical protein